MKKKLLVFVAGILSVLTLTSTVVAQNASAIAASGEKSSKVSFNPFIFSGAAALSAEEKINSKALASFRNAFKNVTNEAWYTIQGGYMAKFLENGISTRVDYDKKGRWESTQKLYKAENAPRDVMKVILTNYFDCSVTLVLELISRDQTAYIVHLEDKSFLRSVTVLNGVIEEVTEYKKGL